MGGRGGSSGLSGGNADIFPKISLDGKTGTEKQKAYAEDLIKSARNTAILNGIAGEHDTDKPGIKRYISKEQADSFIGAYRMFKNGVEIRKTYGEVIDLAKSTDMLKLAHQIESGAKQSGKSVNEFVSDMFEKRKKR